MGVIVVAAGAILVGFFLILLIGHTAPKNAPAPPGGAAIEHGWLSEIGADKFAKLLALLFEALRFDVERTTVDAGMVDLFAVNPTPITGGRIYVRGVYQPPMGLVGEEEVRIAIDTARAEMVGKAIIATPGGFTADARAAAEGNPVDLLDGPELLRLTKKHLPGVAVRQGV